MAEAHDRQPTYQRLRDQLAEQIARQVWQPGQAIPPEVQLAARHGVAVSTVRKALDLLAREGVLERVQGSGTFVRRPDFETAYVKFIRYFGSAGDRRMPRSRILERQRLPGPRAVTEALRLEEGAEVVHLLRLRIHDGLPVLIEDIWLDAARFGPILTMEDDAPQLLYPLYERLCSEVVARAEETITIGTACRRRPESA